MSKGTALSNLFASRRDEILALIAALSPPSIRSCSSPDYSSTPSFDISSVNPCFSAKKLAFLIAVALR